MKIETCCSIINYWMRNIQPGTDFREDNKIHEAVAVDEGLGPQEEEDGKAVVARESRERITAKAKARSEKAHPEMDAIAKAAWSLEEGDTGGMKDREHHMLLTISLFS